MIDEVEGELHNQIHVLREIGAGLLANNSNNRQRNLEFLSAVMYVKRAILDREVAGEIRLAEHPTTMLNEANEYHSILVPEDVDPRRHPTGTVLDRRRWPPRHNEVQSGSWNRSRPS